MTAQHTPAGWYPDPSGAPGQRYFDGNSWTDQFVTGVAPPKKTHSLWTAAAIIVVTIGFFGGCAALFSSSSHDKSSSAGPAPTTPSQVSQHELIDLCQRAVKNELKDPDSAKFDEWTSWEVTNSHKPGPDGMALDKSAGDRWFEAAGTVNAKNSYGGYVGKRGYYCDVVVKTDGSADARSHSEEGLLRSGH